MKGVGGRKTTPFATLMEVSLMQNHALRYAQGRATLEKSLPWVFCMLLVKTHKIYGVAWLPLFETGKFS
jgi:hypothetical protein